MHTTRLRMAGPGATTLEYGCACVRGGSISLDFKLYARRGMGVGGGGAHLRACLSSLAPLTTATMTTTPPAPPTQQAGTGT
jgi:hypothetical protein